MSLPVVLIDIPLLITVIELSLFVCSYNPLTVDRWMLSFMILFFYLLRVRLEEEDLFAYLLMGCFVDSLFLAPSFWGHSGSSAGQYKPP
jgi:hypothetical protein